MIKSIIYFFLLRFSSAATAGLNLHLKYLKSKIKENMFFLLGTVFIVFTVVIETVELHCCKTSVTAVNHSRILNKWIVWGILLQQTNYSLGFQKIPNKKVQALLLPVSTVGPLSTALNLNYVNNILLQHCKSHLYHLNAENVNALWSASNNPKITVHDSK